MKGKTAKKSLPAMHVDIEVMADNSLTESLKNLFVIPFLGPMIGIFGSVDYETIKNHHHHFPNGLSVICHNSILQSVCVRAL